MAAHGERSLIVAGNVYFCDFRKLASHRTSRLVAASGTPHDVRLTAETLQGACRDLIAGAPALVRCAELNAADLVNVAGMIDELAFQAHIMALEGGNTVVPAIGIAELQRLLLDGAAVTAEIQSCMSEAMRRRTSLHAACASRPSAPCCWGGVWRRRWMRRHAVKCRHLPRVC